jgi:hypothetical protein
MYYIISSDIHFKMVVPAFKFEMPVMNELFNEIKKDSIGFISKFPYYMVQMKTVYEASSFYNDLYELIGLLLNRNNRFHQMYETHSGSQQVHLNGIPNGYYIFFSNKDADITHTFTIVENWEDCCGIIVKF